jgi:hypothetical protein
VLPIPVVRAQPSALGATERIGDGTETAMVGPFC